MRCSADGPPEKLPDTPLPPPGTLERYLRPSRTDWSHRIFPSARTVRFNEMEFAVPVERGVDCFLEIRELIRSRFPSVHWAVEYRTVAADTFYLSQAYGADMACISVHDEAHSDWEPFFRAAQDVFLAYAGRPHWGKTHFCDASILAPLYPKWEDFLSVRSELDPGGLFLNSYLRSLFGIVS
jgi:FAD/FMN-containing dehydrogenase